MKSIHRLSAKAVAAAINAGEDAKLPDGGGLRLDIKGKSPSWCFRFVSPGTRKERLMGLGSARSVSLDDARRMAAAARDMVQAGRDPIAEKRQPVTSVALTFQAAAERYISKHESGWRNPKHRQQWRNSLSAYAYPVIGAKPVQEIAVADVAAMLEPIWGDKRETAARVRGRVEMVLDACAALGERDSSNPAAWRVLKHVLPVQRRKSMVKHHAALAYSHVPSFFEHLMTDHTGAALALRFLMLTVARFGEVALATWPEVDLKRKVWKVPAERMKAGRLHEVPLSGLAVATLQEARKRHGDAGLIFPGQRRGKPLSDKALSDALDRHVVDHATVHGVRSTFRDWAGDKTDFQREVIEAALAHTVGNDVEAAYRRGTALEKRRLLMQAWADYCASKVQ